MIEEKHSPAPFGLYSRPPKARDPGGHIIVDAMGDSMAGLAWATGDHPVEEQLANAQLFAASADLLAAAVLGREALAEDLRLTIESSAVLTPGTHEPDLSTLDILAKQLVDDLTANLAEIDAAIARARGLA